MGIKRYINTGRFHRIVQVGSNVHLSGITARNTGGDVAAQTTDVLAQIDDLLSEVGYTKANIVSANIWLSDIGDFDAMNKAWDAWVDLANAPVRATVESRLARPELRVEIQVQAAKAD